MKKCTVLIAGLLLASCSSGAGTTQDTLDPLPDTAPNTVKINRYQENETYEEVTKNSFLVEEYVRDVEVGYGLIDERSQPMVDFLIQRGFEWCDAMSDGMTAEFVDSQILEAAVDQADINLNRAIVIAAAINFCPQHLYMFES